MEYVKKALKESIRFESLHTNAAGPFPAELFKSPGVSTPELSGTSSSGIMLPTVDAKESLGYQVFQNHDDYQSWLRASLYEPSEEEMTEAMQRGSGSN